METFALMNRAGKYRAALGLVLVLVLVVLIVAAHGGGARAFGAEEPAVGRGIGYLKAVAAGQPTGELALACLAMIKAEVPVSDPVLAAGLESLRGRFNSGGYQPDRQGGPDIYEAAVVAMVLANLDTEARRTEIAAIAQYLMGKQNANGSWDYQYRTAGDSSISQYAVLGLWEASNAGADVPPTVFDRAARWYMSTQAQRRRLVLPPR